MRTLSSMGLTPVEPPHGVAAGGEEMGPLYSGQRVAARGGVSLVLKRGYEQGRSSQSMPELDAALPLKEAARRLVDAGSESALVMKDGAVVGLTTLSAILEEMSISRDPLTGLPWSDRLREWGVSRLSSGQEITIVFMDLDNFGQYNKQHGHIIGDRVLQALVSSVAPLVNTARDVFVRYGGDEFVIGTVLPRMQAEELVERLRLIRIQVEGIEDEVAFSLGIAGGKRTSERVTINYHATLDNLINMASVQAIKSKALRDSSFIRKSSSVLRRFLSSHPELAGQLGDVQYEKAEGPGFLVKLVSSSGQVLGSAPLLGDATASLQAALSDWAGGATA